MTSLALVAAPDLEEPLARPGDPCVQCGGERKLRGLHRIHAAADPFCSSNCCRVWHGLDSEDHSQQRAVFRKRSYVRR